MIRWRPVMKLIRIMLGICLAIALAGCSSTGFLADEVGESNLLVQSFEDEVAPGTHRVGILAAEERTALSGGVRNADMLAARLAAQGLTDASIGVQVVDYKGDRTRLRSAVAEMLAAGVELIVAPRDKHEAQIVADIVAGQTSVIALTPDAVTAGSAFSAGMSPGREALGIARELKRRRYDKIAIAFVSSPQSRALTRLMRQAALQENIDAAEVEVGNVEIAISALETYAGPGLDALVFATPPAAAREFVVALANSAQLAEADIVGNAAWALAPPEVLPSHAWYVVPQNSDLSGYAEKFRRAFGETPTLSSAVVYDLVVMAGALPQVVETQPYSADILANRQGFSGATGAFRFDANGRVERTFEVIVAP